METTSIYPALSTITSDGDNYPFKHLAAWERYLETLRWERGSLDQSTYLAALRGASLGIEPDFLFSVVATKIDAAGGHVRAGKVEAQINRAYAFAALDNRAPELRLSARSLLTFPRPRRWSGPDAELIRKTTLSYGGLDDLWESSPVRFMDDFPYTEPAIDILFPGDPLLCVGYHKENFVTLNREKLRGRLNRHPLIVPSPMRKQFGTTKDTGKLSMHCADNVGPRRFIVVEFDDGSPLDEQAARLLHLRQSAPLAMAVFSGNKSLQGWFFCLGQDEEKLRSWFDYACKLGADPQMFVPCQFVRMPDAWRAETSRSGDSGTLKQQTVYYLAPEAAQEVTR